MSKENTWLEAAIHVLVKSNKTWMTSPELVRFILDHSLKDTRTTYEQCVRTLRTVLKQEADKPDGTILKKHYNNGCYFSLRSAGDSPIVSRGSSRKPKHESRAKLRTASPEPCLENGIVSPPNTPSPCVRDFNPNTPTIEIDPSAIISPVFAEPHRISVPSPITSLLAGKRIKNGLNSPLTETSLRRPLREVRSRRRTIEKDTEDILSPLLGEGSPAFPVEMLQLEVCHSLPCSHSVVDCVRSISPGASSGSRTHKEDSCCMIGYQETSPRIEIDPTYVFRLMSDSDQSPPPSNHDENGISLQPTPRSNLYTRKSRRARVTYERFMTEDGSDTEASLAGSSPPPSLVRRPRGRPRGSLNIREKKQSSPDIEMMFERPLEQRQLVSSLFLPTSPLLNENIKTLLGMNSFKDLTVKQKHRLVPHLPPVDHQNGTMVPGDCFTNTFYSSGLREWTERLALGMFTPEYKARVRGDQKRKSTIKPENSWKKQYYERHYGDSLANEAAEAPIPFFPCTAAKDTLLSTITKTYFEEEDTGDPEPLPARQETPSLPPVLPVLVQTPVEKDPIPAKKTQSPKIRIKIKPVKVPNRRKKLKTTPSTLLEKLKLKKKILDKVKKEPPSKKPIAKKLPAGAIKKKVIGKGLPREFLMSSPAKISYSEILRTLKSMTDLTETPQSIDKVTTSSFTSPPAHTHSVYLDHFSLLSREHVPVDFNSRVTSLPMSLPLNYYNSCLEIKKIIEEHSYSSLSSSPLTKSFSLSLPRSLLNRNGCFCDGKEMLQCPNCQSFYHSDCSESLCSLCTVLN